MQGIFKRTAITGAVVMKRLCFNSLWLQRKQTELTFLSKSCQGAQSWLPVNQQGELHLWDHVLYIWDAKTSSLQYLQMLRFKLKMFYLPFNHQVVGGAPCTRPPLLSPSPHLAWSTPSPPHALGMLTAHLSHSTWHHCWFLSVFLNASWVPQGQKN